MKWNAPKISTIATALAGFGASVLIVGALAWMFWPAPAVPVAQHLPAKQAPDVKDVPTETVAAPPKLTVYKQRAKERLKLPDPVAADETQQVAASSRVEPDEHAHTVTTLVDLKTGQFQTFDRREPLPWFDLRARHELEFTAGLKNFEPAGRLDYRFNFMKTKAVDWNAKASVDTDADWMVGTSFKVTF